MSEMDEGAATTKTSTVIFWCINEIRYLELQTSPPLHSAQVRLVITGYSVLLADSKKDSDNWEHRQKRGTQMGNEKQLKELKSSGLEKRK